MSAVGLARAAIREAILAHVDQLPPWRIHAHPPTQVVAPCIWVDMPALSQAELYTDSTWPVLLLYDGTDGAQITALDHVVAVIWDAVNAVDGMAALDATAVQRDIGGPSLRAHQVTVSVPLVLDTLCISPLSEAVTVPP